MKLALSVLPIKRSVGNRKNGITDIMLGARKSVGDRQAGLLIGITASILWVCQSVGDRQSYLLNTLCVLLVLLNSLLTVDNGLDCLQKLVS